MQLFAVCLLWQLVFKVAWLHFKYWYMAIQLWVTRVSQDIISRQAYGVWHIILWGHCLLRSSHASVFVPFRTWIVTWWQRWKDPNMGTAEGSSTTSAPPVTLQATIGTTTSTIASVASPTPIAFPIQVQTYVLSNCLRTAAFPRRSFSKCWLTTSPSSLKWIVDGR